ncbi:MAG: GyrI-like domain-containing protein [Oligoflexia bacterium]|nr:GyrI-like domain-containing protein [Oligoflexia bacterium]
MKKFVKYTMFLLAGIIVVVLGVLAYSGLFSSVEYVAMDMGPYTIAYQEFTGDYSRTGPVFEKVYKDLEAMGIKTTKGMGIYYDDPKTTPRDQCRSDIGVIVDEPTMDVVKAIRESYEIKIVPEGKYLVAEFPYRTKLSILIGVFKAYPELENEIRQNGYVQKECMELYDSVNNKILYMMKI